MLTARPEMGKEMEGWRAQETELMKRDDCRTFRWGPLTDSDFLS